MKKSQIDSEARPNRRWPRLLVLGSLLAGVTVVAGAPASSAWTSNGCTNEPTVLSGGEDFGINVGPGVFFVGFDTEAGRWATLDPSLVVCVNDDQVGVTTTTTGGPYVWVNQCTRSVCTPLVGDTGLEDTSRPTAISIVPTSIDTGYDVYVNGTFVTSVKV